MPDQTKPNQTNLSGILHFVQHSVRAYQKKFQLSRSNGSWDMGSGKFKIWKTSILGFFEKWPPGAPKNGKNQFWWVPWWFWTPMVHQKKFRPFSGRGVIKCVHAYWTAPYVKLKYHKNSIFFCQTCNFGGKEFIFIFAVNLTFSISWERNFQHMLPCPLILTKSATGLSEIGLHFA